MCAVVQSELRDDPEQMQRALGNLDVHGTVEALTVFNWPH